MEHWQWEEEQDRREAETFRRLHRLKKAGYKVGWGGDVEDAFFLDHLGSGPSLIFYPSGMIVSLNKEVPISRTDSDDPDRVLNRAEGDIADFDRWLNTIEKPTWWQSGHPDREKYVYQPGFAILFILGAFGFGKLLEQLWVSLTR